MNPQNDDLIRKRARKIVDAGDVPKATLQESIEINEKLGALLSKESIQIPEFPSFPEIPKYPTEITVSNLPEVQRVEVTNFPKQEAPIVNVPAPKVTVNVPPIVLPPFPEIPKTSINMKGLESTMTNISDTLEMMRTNSEKKGTREMVMQNHGYSAVNIKNTLDEKISPATEAKQNAILVEQTTLNELVETLQELTSRLTAIASTVANTAQLRVIGSVVVTSAPSTAVTGPITSAQSIAEKAVGGISYPEKMAMTNSGAILSNINNVAIN